jgi:hypothetical protein
MVLGFLEWAELSASQHEYFTVMPVISAFCPGRLSSPLPHIAPVSNSLDPAFEIQDQEHYHVLPSGAQLLH